MPKTTGAIQTSLRPVPESVRGANPLSWRRNSMLPLNVSQRSHGPWNENVIVQPVFVLAVTWLTRGGEIGVKQSLGCTMPPTSFPQTSPGMEEISFANPVFRPRTSNRYTQLQTTGPMIRTSPFVARPQSQSEGSLSSFSYNCGLVISCPFLTVAGGDVHNEMRKYLYISVGVLASTICVIILIIIGAALPPGEYPHTACILTVQP